MMLKKLVLPLFVALFLSAGLAFAADKINVNTANKVELQTLKGIGAATADAIIKYRELNGAFSSVEDLANVKGIGNKKMAKLSDQLTVSDAE